jgi:hypothetical protein
MRAWQRVRRIVFSLSSFDGDWQKGQGFSLAILSGPRFTPSAGFRKGR